MCAHSKEIIDKFRDLCDRLMQIWQMRKYLFDDNPDRSALFAPRNGFFFVHIQAVLQESWLHQLAKLHDPAVQGGAKGHINLSIDYMIEYGHWKPEVKVALNDLKTKMEVLAKPIRDARNKILAHNDLAVLLAGQELGGFNPGEDETYFLNLREFAHLVTTTALGEEQPFTTYDCVKTDVHVFMRAFLKGKLD